jgi:hypothetical protein
MAASRKISKKSTRKSNLKKRRSTHKRVTQKKRSYKAGMKFTSLFGSTKSNIRQNVDNAIQNIVNGKDVEKNLNILFSNLNSGLATDEMKEEFKQKIDENGNKMLLAIMKKNINYKLISQLVKMITTINDEETIMFILEYPNVLFHIHEYDNGIIEELVDKIDIDVAKNISGELNDKQDILDKFNALRVEKSKNFAAIIAARGDSPYGSINYAYGGVKTL